MQTKLKAKGRFLGKLLENLSASLLGSLLAGRRVVTAENLFVRVK